MLEISRFVGIIVAMYYNDHGPPHFHTIYGDYEAKVNIITGEIIDGGLPNRARRLVREWWSLHRVDLSEDWALAEARKQLRKIEPLE